MLTKLCIEHAAREGETRQNAKSVISRVVDLGALLAHCARRTRAHAGASQAHVVRDLVCQALGPCAEG